MAIVGGLIIALGIVLLPLPGPGWLIILAGLATLSMEFRWARKALLFTREQVRRWTKVVQEGSWLVRITSTALTLVVIGAALWLSFALLD